MTLDIRSTPGQEFRAETLRTHLDAQRYRHTGSARLTLEVTPAGLMLTRADNARPLRLHLDFSRGRQGYRLAHAGQQREELIRALGTIPRHGHVIDATAGLGRDTLLLAAHGFRVDAWERHPVLHLLLQDALERASLTPDLAPLSARITLHAGPATPEHLPERPLAAVFDPMFPGRRKQAAVKKDMQVVQALLENDPDPAPEPALQRLRRCVQHRIIVKRPLHAPPIGPDPPQASRRGQSTRFDLYLPA